MTDCQQVVVTVDMENDDRLFPDQPVFASNWQRCLFTRKGWHWIGTIAGETTIWRCGGDGTMLLVGKTLDQLDDFYNPENIPLF